MISMLSGVSLYLLLRGSPTVSETGLSLSGDDSRDFAKRHFSHSPVQAQSGRTPQCHVYDVERSLPGVPMRTVSRNTFVFSTQTHRTSKRKRRDRETRRMSILTIDTPCLWQTASLVDASNKEIMSMCGRRHSLSGSQRICRYEITKEHE